MTTIITSNEKKTKEIAEELAKQIKYPAILCLYGDLGSGKTTFVKGFAAALKVREKDIKSPTYTLIRTHSIDEKHKLHHLDLYRAEEHDSFLVKELEEILKDENAIVLIEWAERIEKFLPQKVLKIYFEHVDPEKRRITISPETYD